MDTTGSVSNFQRTVLLGGFFFCLSNFKNGFLIRFLLKNKEKNKKFPFYLFFNIFIYFVQFSQIAESLDITSLEHGKKIDMCRNLRYNLPSFK